MINFLLSLMIIPSIHQQAILPFIPWILIALGGALGGGVMAAIIYGLASIWDDSKSKALGMAVLGENQAGKTLWYDYLCNTHYSGAHTIERDVDKIDIKYNDGRTVHIRKGIDINGDRSFMKSHYAKMVTENDVILFFNNIDQYH